MAFIKFASVSTIDVATNDGAGFVRTASQRNSAFLDGTRSIDIKAALELVADAYKLSSNPKDYVFEAIRGNTVNVPNDNSDCFGKDELLRFDHRLGKRVYRTYELKPHQ